MRPARWRGASRTAGSFAGDRQHVAVVQQAVEERRGDHGVAKDLALLAHRAVRGDQNAATLVAPRHELEEQVCGMALEGRCE